MAHNYQDRDRVRYPPQTAQPQRNPRSQQQPQSFYQKVDKIRQDFQGIQNSIQDLQSVHSKIISSSNSAQSDVLSEKAGAMADDIGGRLQKQRIEIKSLGGQQQSQKTQQQALAQKLVTIAKEFQNVQTKFKTNLNARVKRELKIVYPNASPAEIEKRVLEGPGRVYSQGLGSSRQAYDSVKSRHQELLNLEKSLNELYNLFNDMQILLTNQQDMIDNIERNVDESVEFLEQGTREMSKAVVHAQRARKSKWWVFWLCLVGILVAGFLVYWFLVKPNMK